MIRKYQLKSDSEIGFIIKIDNVKGTNIRVFIFLSNHRDLIVHLY